MKYILLVSIFVFAGCIVKKTDDAIIIDRYDQKRERNHDRPIVIPPREGIERKPIRDFNDGIRHRDHHDGIREGHRNYRPSIDFHRKRNRFSFEIN